MKTNKGSASLPAVSVGAQLSTFILAGSSDEECEIAVRRWSPSWNLRSAMMPRAVVRGCWLGAPMRVRSLPPCGVGKRRSLWFTQETPYCFQPPQMCHCCWKATSRKTSQRFLAPAPLPPREEALATQSQHNMSRLLGLGMSASGWPSNRTRWLSYGDW